MQSLGLITVTTHGVPVPLSSTEIRCTKIWVQPIKTLAASGSEDTENAGTVYLLNSSSAKGASSTNIMLRIPQGANTIPFESSQPNGYNLATIYIDAVNDGDGALVSYA